MLTKTSYNVKLTPKLVPQDPERPTFSVDDAANLTVSSGDFSATFTREEALRLAGFIERYCKQVPSIFFDWGFVDKKPSCYAAEA